MGKKHSAPFVSRRQWRSPNDRLRHRASFVFLIYMPRQGSFVWHGAQTSDTRPVSSCLVCFYLFKAIEPLSLFLRSSFQLWCPMNSHGSASKRYLIVCQCPFGPKVAKGLYNKSVYRDYFMESFFSRWKRVGRGLRWKECKWIQGFRARSRFKGSRGIRAVEEPR